MDIEKITIAATNFRNAIEKISTSLGVSFESFPRGSCGDASPLLGTYLIEQGLGEFKYILGNYGSEEEGDFSSHAWLQSNHLIVDITADQFSDIDNSVIVSEISDWHVSLNGEEQNVGDYRIYDSRTAGELGGLYKLIVNEINK